MGAPWLGPTSDNAQISRKNRLCDLLFSMIWVLIPRKSLIDRGLSLAGLIQKALYLQTLAYSPYPSAFQGT